MSKIENVSHVAQTLKTEREKQKLSVYQLAKDTGINRTVIHRIENGTSAPGTDTLIKILTALKCELCIVPFDGGT